MGNFNIHWNILTNSNSLKCYYIIGSLKLKQHVNGHTHNNMLDLMISRKDEDFLQNITVNEI